MEAHMKAQPRKGVRGRLLDRARAKVRFWVDGHQIRYFDVAGDQRLEWDYPSYPTMKIVESVPNDGETVRVGRYCGIHYTVTVIPGGQHHAEWVGTLHSTVDEHGNWVNMPEAIYSKGPIVIGNDVFVAFEGLILSGVTIGDGAIVAPRTVVHRDVAPYEIVGGNPMKHIRFRFDEPTREALQRIRWWDWSVERVHAHRDQINSPDVAGFIERHDPALGQSSCAVCAATP